MLQQVTLKGLRIPHSGFHTFHKVNKNMADRVQITFHRLLPLLRWVKTIATWKTGIESVQSLGMDNPSGLCDGETPAKWQSKASFATHPSTETEWRTKLLARFSS